MKLKSLVLSALVAGDGGGGFNAHFGDTFAASTVGSRFSELFTFNLGAHPTDSWSSSGFGLTRGSYALKVNGQVMGAGGGDLTVSPVPEPQVWGMLLAGLGLVGMAGRRKLAPCRVQGR